jgi:outer membrane protein TolC
MKKFSLFFLVYACIMLWGNFPNHLYAEEQKVVLKYSDLRKWAETNSPVYRIIEERNSLKSADARIQLGLQATNPRFSYTQEYVKDDSLQEREQLFTISKTFEMPWLYKKRRQSYRQMENVLKFDKESQIRKFMIRMKSGYAALSVMNEQLSLMGQVKKHLKKMAETAKSRKKNGFLTGYEKKLIDISLLNLEGKILTLTRKRRELENHWKMEMGIKPGTRLHLINKLSFKIIKIDNIDTDKILKQMPGFGQLEHEGRVLSLGLKLEKVSVIPDVTLFAGYKMLNPDIKGYAAGLSFDLPILNRNGNAIKKRKLDLEIHKNRFSLFKKENELRLKEKILAVQEYGAFLTPMSNHFNSLLNQLDPVVSAYGEGLLSTNDFVNILQTYVGALEQYHNHLLTYFDTISQVEAMTGNSLITF